MITKTSQVCKLMIDVHLIIYEVVRLIRYCTPIKSKVGNFDK